MHTVKFGQSTTQGSLRWYLQIKRYQTLCKVVERSTGEEISHYGQSLTLPHAFYDSYHDDI